MVTLEELVVKIKVEMGNLKSEMAQAQASVKGFGDETDHMERKSSSSLRKLIPSWQAIGAAAGLAATAMVGAGLKMVQLAADADATVSKFNVVFGEGAGAATEWAESISQATGRNKYDVMELTSTMQALMVGMGTNRDEAAKMSEAYYQLGLDMAAFYNTTDEEAVNAIKSGLAGESEPLKRFGVLLTETAVQEELVAMKGGDMAAALAAAGDDPEKLEMVKKQYEDITKNVTDAEKMQARYNIIMRQTADLQGQQAREAKGYQEQMKRLFATLKEGAADAGKKAMESMTGILNKVNELLSGGGTDALMDMFTGIADAVAWVAEKALDLGLAFASWGKNGGFDALRELGSSTLKNITAAFKPAIDAVKEFAGNGGLGRLSEAVKNAIRAMAMFSDILRDAGVYDFIGKNIGGVVRAFLWLVDTVSSVINWMARLYQSFRDAYDRISTGTTGLRSVLSSDWNAITSLISGAASGILSSVSDSFTRMRTSVSNAMEDVRSLLSSAWNTIRGVVVGAGAAILGAVVADWNTIRNAITSAMSSIGSAVSGGWNSVRSVVISAGSAILSSVTADWNSIRTSITTAMSSIGSSISTGWNSIRSGISSAMSSIGSAVSTGWNSIRSGISTAMNSINSGVSSGWNTVKSTISTGVSNAVSVVTGAAGSFYSAGADWISNLISGITSKISSLQQKTNEALELVGLGSGGGSSSGGSSKGGSSGGGTGSAKITAAGLKGSYTTVPKGYNPYSPKVNVTINNKAADVNAAAKTTAKVLKSGIRAVSV